jgi:gliding motility-associated-like protein
LGIYSSWTSPFVKSTAQIIYPMKTILNSFLLLILTAFALQAQPPCPYDNAIYTDLTPIGSTTNSDACAWGGDIITVNVVSGETYEFSTCGSALDVTMTLYDATGTTVLASDDDGCGTVAGPSLITWTATFTGTVHLLIDEYPCASATNCIPIDVTCTSCGTGGGGGSCNYQLDLFDSFGDGWDGSTVDVTINGTSIGTYTVTGSSNTVTFSANNCDVVALSFTSAGGLWDSEVSYNLYELPNTITPIFTADYSLTVLTGPVFYTTCGTGCGGNTVDNSTCDSMAPICTNAGALFDANVSGTNAVFDYIGPNYDCLLSGPDPTYWYFEISQSGAIDMALNGQGDIDFIIWGPYADLAAAQASCGSMGTGGLNGSVIDCSFDPTNQETPSIPSAVVGQVYIMMVTNYAAVPQTISLTQTAGTGATDCTITCPADAGTVTTTINGNPVIPGNPAVLCWGECINIETDSNYVLPTPVSGEIAEIMYAIYTGAPDPAIPDPANDPNYSGLLWTGGDFSDCNDPTSTILGAGLGNHVWFVPITMDDGDDNNDPNAAINWDNNGDSCWALGTPIEIAFLDSITATVTDDCQTITFTLAGGYPEFTGTGTYTVVNTGPGTMTQSGANGEIITFSGFTPGQTVSFDVSNDGNSCFNTFSYTTNTAPTITLDNIVNANCGANDGAVNVTVTQTPCNYTIDLFDSFGDGWNGASLAVTVGGVAIPGSPFTFTTGFNASFNFTALPGQAVVFTYSPGAWEGEVTYDIYQDGNLVFSDGPNPATGVVFSSSCPPYTYSWSNGASTEDLTNVGTGSYTLTVTDGNGCTASSGPHNVVETGGVTATIASVTNVLCSGDLSGAVDINATGGLTPYVYTWSNGATTQDISGVGAGVYTVTVVDNNGAGCTSIVSATITEPSALTASAVAADASCNGATDGSVDLTVGGGSPAYSFSWSNGATTEDLAAVGAGTYTVTVTDLNGCTITASATVNEPTALTASATATDVSCNGATDGSVDLTVGGGSPAYSFSWSNGATTEDLAAVGAGTYTVTVTDLNGCTITATATVNEPTALTASATATDVSCNGATDGSVDLTVGGGSPAYSFSWSNGATTEDLAAVGAGTYTVTVTDLNGCTITASATVNEPTALTASAVAADASCNGATDGSVDLTVGGGSPAYSFSWSNGATTEDLAAVGAGTYTVTVTDLNGCTITASATVNEPTAITASTTVIDAACGGSNGSIDLTVGGGSPAYSFSWSNGATTEDLAAVGAGTYTVTVTDLNGCTITASATVNEPTTLTASATATDASCNGATDGSVDLTVGGGSPTYSFSWSNGATTEDLAAVGAGTYTVTVTDLNGCTITASATVNEPTAITASTTVIDAACGGSNGSIDLTVGGGSPAYSFSWSNGATTEDISGLSAGAYSVTITDNNGCTISTSANVNTPSGITATSTTTDVACNGDATGAIDLTATGGTAPYTFNWSNAATTEDINNVVAGIYTVTITDATSCVSILTDTITENPAINIVLTPTDASCNGASDGCVVATVSGGSGNYGYSWPNGATLDSICGLAAGNYTLTVTDTVSVGGAGSSQLCVATATTTINEPTALTMATDSVIDETCTTTGGVYITVGGGTAPYSFNWSDGSTNEDLTGVTAGSYSVTLTDNNGCTMVLGPETVASVGTPTASLNTSSNVSCNGAADGSIDITVSAGTAPYTFVWDNTATTEDLSGLGAGTYNVTVTDDLGCQTTLGPINITEPTALGSSATTVDVDCNAAANGSINLTITGGTAPYTFIWDNAATTEDLTGLSGGSYNVTATDANGCVITDGPFVINEPTALAVSNIVTTDASCAGGDGAIDITVSGGSPAYSFAWDNGATTEDISGLNAGSYVVDVTDANGCSATTTVTIASGSNITVSLVSTTDESCAIDSSGAIDIDVAGGTAPYSFAWDNGASTEDLSNVSGGNYTVTVTDANGCASTLAATVNNPTIPTLNATISADSMILNDTAVVVDAGADQTAVGVSYNWTAVGVGNANIGNTNVPNTIVQPDEVGNYIFLVTATSAEGCVAEDSVSLVVTDLNDPQIPTAFTPNNDQVNDQFRVLYLDTEYLVEFKVFNRWGTIVYDHEVEGNGEWDGIFNGVAQPSDAYIYIISWQLPGEAEATVVRGSVTLLR